MTPETLDHYITGGVISLGLLVVVLLIRAWGYARGLAAIHAELLKLHDETGYCKISQRDCSKGHISETIARVVRNYFHLNNRYSKLQVERDDLAHHLTAAKKQITQLKQELAQQTAAAQQHMQAVQQATKNTNEIREEYEFLRRQAQQLGETVHQLGELLPVIENKSDSPGCAGDNGDDEPCPQNEITAA